MLETKLHSSLCGTFMRLMCIYVLWYHKELMKKWLIISVISRLYLLVIIQDIH